MSLPACFAQLPGMYPNAAGKLVTNVPYKGKVGAPAPPRADSTRTAGLADATVLRDQPRVAHEASLCPALCGLSLTAARNPPQEDMYSKCGFTAAESAAVKKYDGKFIFLEPRPEYIIDNINNGLYR